MACSRTKIFEHEKLSHEKFLTQKFPDLRYKHCLNLNACTHVDVLEFLQALVKLTRVFVNYRTPKMEK